MWGLASDTNDVLYFLAFPEWVEHINDTEVDIGSDLYWPCVATGKPIPTIRWLKNGYSVSVFKSFVVLKPMFRKHFWVTWDKVSKNVSRVRASRP